MKKYFWVLLILFLSWWAIKPLVSSNLFPIHDDTQVVRVHEMREALIAGQFPVRWVGDLGYGFGYPLFNFYAPLAYYFGGIVNAMGANAIASTQFMMIVPIVLSGFLMFLLAKEIWGNKGGFISALLYLYAPYHALDLYVRGAIGELWAIAFLPLPFLGLIKIFERKKSGILISAVGLAAIILSHNLTAVMIIPIYGAILIVGLLTKKCSFVNTLAIIFGLGLSAFYWLPALKEMKLTNVTGQIGGGADFRDHFLYFDQVWASPWGYGGSSVGRLDGMSFMLGKIHLFLGTIILLIIFLVRKKEKKSMMIIGVLTLIFLASLFLTHSSSLLIWETLPAMSFFQYPWRFLLLATFALSLLSGAMMLFFQKRHNLYEKIFLTVFALVVIMFNQKYFRPQKYLALTEEQYLSEENIKWTTSKISDEYLPAGFPEPQKENEVAWEKVNIITGDATIEKIDLKPHVYRFNVVDQTPSKIMVNTAYFPGWWQVWVNGENANYSVEKQRFLINLPQGTNAVIMKFVGTPIQKFANVVSLLSGLGLVVFMLELFRGPRTVKR